ncbi:hypothetical protein BJ684DRAFT_9158, partial [Piptocephalis cylindrospora]
IMTDMPNVLPWARALETDRAVYIQRQYLTASLYDRISTRPFLANIERKWVAFQLCRAVADLHTRHIYHGDIKTENIMVTSWNWVYLCDFASFKPTYLPEDNPSDFSYFFDTAGRRTCYLAPERFYSPDSSVDRLKVSNSSMDIFSLGCVIAELFRDGSPTLTLSQLLRYRKGKYDPMADVGKIDDPGVARMVGHMLQLDPSKRHSASQYLQSQRGHVFPEYFYTFLHPYMASLDLPSPSGAPVDTGSSVVDQRISKLYHDAEQIDDELKEAFDDIGVSDEDDGTVDGLGLEVRGDASSQCPAASPSCSGYLIYLALLCSCTRHCDTSEAKLRLLDLFLRISPHISDEAKLDRLLPYVMTLRSDGHALVRSRAIHVIALVLESVQNLSPINTGVFTDYILPGLRRCIADSEPLVRAAYAGIIATLAETAVRYIDLAQSIKRDSGTSLPIEEENLLQLQQGDRQAAMDRLLAQLHDHLNSLLVDGDATVRRALLSNGSLTRLCVVFGRAKANDFLLSHVITYLNDRDWLLRSAFLEAMVGLATFVGSRSLEEYLLPLLVQALTDSEEAVVARVLSTIAALAGLRLFQRPTLRDLATTVAPLLCHPNAWVRASTLQCILQCSRQFPVADLWCFLHPAVRPCLRCDVPSLERSLILKALKPPLPRAMFDVAVAWAGRSRSFLEGMSLAKGIGAGGLLHSSSGVEIRERTGGLRDLGRGNSRQDDEFLEKLRHLRMGPEDEEKMWAMREYLSKLARTRQGEGSSSVASIPSVVQLKNVNATPKTVFLHPVTDFLPDHSADIEDAMSMLGSTMGGGGTGNSMAASILDIRSMAMGESGKRVSLDVSKPSHDVSSHSIPENPSSMPSHMTLLDKQEDQKSGESQTDGATRARSSTMDGEGMRISRSTPLSFHRASRASPSPSPSSPSPLIITSSSSSSTSTMDGLSNHGYTTIPHPSPASSSFSVTTPSSSTALPSPSAVGGVWKPRGILLAQLTEHTGSIITMAISPDQTFLASGGADGAVRIWDVARLLRGTSHRARTAFDQFSDGGVIRCMTFLEGRHAIAAASSTGQIRVFRSTTTGNGDLPQYGRCQVVREHQLDTPAQAVAMHHYVEEEVGAGGGGGGGGGRSILLVATTEDVILALSLHREPSGDLKELWRLQSIPHHGTLTTMLLDPRRHWLLTGTAHGVLTLWDLRFKVRVRSWLHPRRRRITTLALYGHGIPRGRLVLVGTEGAPHEATVWDLETGVCREVYTTEVGEQEEGQATLHGDIYQVRAQGGFIL